MSEYSKGALVTLVKRLEKEVDAMKLQTAMTISDIGRAECYIAAFCSLSHHLMSKLPEQERAAALDKAAETVRKEVEFQRDGAVDEEDERLVSQVRKAISSGYPEG